jgi:transcriptional regulator with XRE-family HTH domain
MTLKEWLVRTKCTQADFANEIGVSQQLVNRWAAGVHRPRLPLIFKIEAATKGKVTARDFVK